MFAGGRRRTSSIRIMQLFHELKQQFPTVPDHVVSACIANYTANTEPPANLQLRQALEAALRRASPDDPDPMGRTLTKPADPALSSLAPAESASAQFEPQRTRSEMSDSDINDNLIKPTVFYSKGTETVSVSPAERPAHLDLNVVASAPNKIQPSERCFDLQKLLKSDGNLEKPPRSPLSAKRSSKSPRRETAETPTQTSETLLGSGVNLSLNVNCQMDVVRAPKRTSVLNVTPQLPWCQEAPSPRSYTSVNLTLRPPSSQPQPPIDITSQNSSLTYSTSSFDSQNGLQSRLQITVGPGGGGVSSFRTRPKSSYHPEARTEEEEEVPVRAGSLPDLTAETKLSVITKQRACLETLRKELTSERRRLSAMQREISLLENPDALVANVDDEVEKQLLTEIRHLRGQCERLAFDVDRHSESRVPLCETNEEFYRNIYTGQHSRLTLGPLLQPIVRQATTTSPLSGRRFVPELEGPKWNCHLCTFRNHPLLDKCEECDMPRILHGRKSEPPNPCLIGFRTRSPDRSLRNLVSNK